MNNISGKTFVGRRERNEDSIYYEIFEKPRGNLIGVMAVADGIGGQGGGPEASRIAINTLKKSIRDCKEINENEAESFIKNVYAEAHNKIIEKSKQAPVFKGMGSTMVSALIFKEKILIANLADSRAYKISEDECIQITKDHTVVQDSIDRGIATIKEIIETPAMLQMAGALMKSLGDEHKEPEPDIFLIDNTSPQTILLCSDGLSGGIIKPILIEEEIKRQVSGAKNLDFACNNLISLAFQKGSTDNISVIIYSTEKLPKEKAVKKESPPERLLKKERRALKFFFLKKKVMPLIALFLFVLFIALSIAIYNKAMPYFTKIERVEEKIKPKKKATKVKKISVSEEKKKSEGQAQTEIKIIWVTIEKDKIETKRGDLIEWKVEPVLPDLDFIIFYSKSCNGDFKEILKTKEKNIKIEEIVKDEEWVDGREFCLRIEAQTPDGNKFYSNPLKVKLIGR